MNFFSFNFPLRKYFFGTSPPPPHPISFLMVRPLAVLSTFPMHGGEGFRSCNIQSMVPHASPTKIISHCAGPLACFKCLSDPWGKGVRSCNIHSMVPHASPTKISSYWAGPLACFKCFSHPWGEGALL